MNRRRPGIRLSSFRIIIAGFAGVILTGAVLLMLPVSARSGEWTSFENACFTSASAVCVTGLVVLDTASYWSYFGQAVILLLIQTGGLGVVTVAAFIAEMSGKRISLLQRSTLQDSISADQPGGLGKMTRFIFRVTFIAEAAGAAAMLPVFLGSYGARGIWMAVFHSVSAFCNAGFDIMGTDTGAFSSLTAYAGNAWIVLPVCLLIMAGGAGSLTWKDIAVRRFNFKRYRMQSKVIITATAALIFFPALVFFLNDFSGSPMKERIFHSLFQAVTPRTAGFNTADMSAMTSAGRALIIMLMLTGGSPGSTAGGMKTTTAAVLLANAAAVGRGRKSPRLFGRRIDDETVKSALKLTPMEYKLLCLLAKHTGKVLTHTFITQNIWGRSWDNDVASLRVFMVTLRKKLESLPDSPRYIQTHIGIGYRMLKVV